MHRKCQCQYIPPHVTGRILRSGTGISSIDDASLQKLRDTELGAKAFRQSRKASPEARGLQKSRAPGAQQGNVAAAAAPGAAGNGAPIVYNCDRSVNLRSGDPLEHPLTDASAARAYKAAKTVKNYFATQLGRDSIDDKGMDVILNVHYGEGYANAFWDGDEMAFGDGDGDIFADFASSLDVVAHELAHGVTQHTANLDYYAQSGALNEHFSDVFGTAITQHDADHTADNADWLIGNEIMGQTLAGETLRSMKAPGTAYSNSVMGDDPQPAHMRDFYTGEADFRGVHINSGILNRVFYLVATDQLGTARAARLWYQTLLQLWPTAEFDDFAEVLINTTKQMCADQALPKGSTQTVRLALRDVGLL